MEDVYELVRLYEFGGTPRSDYIKYADGISFFDVNINFYYKREGLGATRERAIWGFNRFSDRAKKIVKEFKFKDKELQALIEKLL